MATVLLVGSDDAMLEGLAQMLLATGHRAIVARTVSEAMQVAAADSPLVTLVERSRGVTGEVLRLPQTGGGALVLYRSPDEEVPPLPGAVRRATLAELLLPLERHRLLTLVQHLESRARRTGRGRIDTPPEHHSVS